MKTYEFAHPAPYNGFSIHGSKTLNDYVNNTLYPMVYDKGYKLMCPKQTLFIIDFKKSILIDSITLATGFPYWDTPCQSIGIILYDNKGNILLDNNDDLLASHTYKINKRMTKLAIYFKKNNYSDNCFMRELNIKYNDTNFVFISKNKDNSIRSIVDNTEIIINNYNDVPKYYCDKDMISILNNKDNVEYVLSK